MWYLAQTLLQSKVEHATTMLGALESTLRNLLLVSTVFYLISAMVLSSSWDGPSVLWLMVVILLVGLSFALANFLLSKNYLLSFLAWLAGSIITILGVCWLMQSPDLVLLAAILPLIAAITISGWAGLAAGGLVVGMVGLVNLPIFGGPPADNVVIVTVGASALSGLLGWTAYRQLLDVAIWSMKSYDGIRHNLSEIQDRQIELAQAQEDLNLANRELARLLQRTRVLERIAEEARQAKTEFVANVSHELRTPLNMIIGYADLISKSPKVYGAQIPPALLADIKAILSNAQHLSNLVNDVLDLSQVESGRVALSKTWVAPEKIIQEAMTVVKRLYESKGLQLKAEIQENMQPVYCDELRIRQVVINLLSNAGRFTERGGVTIRCLENQDGLSINVTDTGPGIDSSDQQRIFEPFQQANTSIRRRFGGSGLGLTISKQFVEMHGGKMQLESQVGVGTTFSFSLPYENLALPAAGTTSANPRRAIIPDDEIGYSVRRRPFHANMPTSSNRYMLVDAEKNLERLITRHIPNSQVETFPDIDAACEALDQSPVQAVILNMPAIDESSSLKLGRLPLGTPSITCWLPGEHEAAQRLGALEYLIKPVTQEKLLAAIARLGEQIKTVLIVDDEEDELHLFARHLESYGPQYKILQVTSGRRALSMLRTRHPDLMLLDLTMPGMGGVQVMEEKLRDPEIRDIPVIIISARDPSGDPILSDTFTVTHSGGLSQRNLIDCIHAISEILAPNTIQKNREGADQG